MRSLGGALSNEPNSIRGVYKEFEISPKPKESHWLRPMFIVPATLSFMPGATPLKIIIWALAP